MPHYQGRGLHEPLLPLHTALGWVIAQAFPIDDQLHHVPVYSLQFTERVTQIIAREILEVGSTPATFTSLRNELDPLVKAETAQVVKRNARKRGRGTHVDEEYEKAEQYVSWLTEFSKSFADMSDGCGLIDCLEKDLRERLNRLEDDDPGEMQSPLERTSCLGLFTRSLINTFRKLSFDETAHLAQEIAKWCGHSGGGLSKPVSMWSLDRKSGLDDTLDKRVKAMEDFQASNASADYSNALASLRGFYDYQLPTATRGQHQQHQHALLNIAAFHYSTGGLESARSAVDEAIRVARNVGDKGCLQQCMSLLQRIQSETSSVAFAATETVRIHQTAIPPSRLPAGATPMDELWSVKAALDLGEPVHIAFRRIHSALGKELQSESGGSEDERRGGKQWRTGEVLDRSAWHATQAGLWNLLGSNTLAEFHEEMALKDLAPWSDGRLTVILTRAQRATDRAEYDQALALLLDMSVLKGMTIPQYHRWARMVWAIMERRTTMNGDPETLSYLSSLQPPKDYSTRLGPGGPSRELGHPSPLSPSSLSPITDSSQFSQRILLVQEHVRDSLRKATKLQASAAPAPQILPHVLSAVELSAELGLWVLYRYGVVVLAEVMLGMEGMGMAEKVIREVESVWDQVLGGGDVEVIARGALCLGKANIELALDNESADLLNEATRHLTHALKAATKLESRSLILECTSLLSLSMDLGIGGGAPSDEQGIKERDAMVARYELAKKGAEVRGGQIGGLARKVAEVVKLVGVRAAEGWS
ncbi:hypothetical protein IAT38_001118 [Cryptococcus sp. DSM 104549]